MVNDTKRDDYHHAVDVVCLACNYLSEETCEKCPVRLTYLDRMFSESDPDMEVD